MFFDLELLFLEILYLKLLFGKLIYLKFKILKFSCFKVYNINKMVIQSNCYIQKLT
jgi:hypothetical protein